MSGDGRMGSNRHGRPYRLPNYDYGENGCYFITFCTKGRIPILSRVTMNGTACVGRGLAPGIPGIQLLPIGEILEEQISLLKNRFPVTVDRSVIMPNHCHLLLSIDKGLPGASPRPTEDSAPPSLSRIIGACKSLTTRLANQRDDTPGREVFQSSYYDHVIRSEEDYLTHWRYIDENPAKWTEDEYYISSKEKPPHDTIPYTYLQ